MKDRARVVAKWIGLVIGGLAVVGVGLFGVATWTHAARVEARYAPPRHALTIPTLDDAARGEAERLYRARGCADCHAEDGGGAVVIDAPPLFVAGPNLTGSSLTGAEMHAAVRRGVDADGAPLFFMPSHEYARMPDAELGLIVAHVRALPPQRRELPESELRPLGRVLALFGVFDTPIYPAEIIDQAEPAVSEATPGELGERLAAGCRGCHGQGLTGGPIPGAPEEQTGVPRNLTPHETGLRGWTLAQFEAALRTGSTPTGRLNPRFMPISATRHLTDPEIAALFAYLQGLEPRPFGGR